MTSSITTAELAECGIDQALAADLAAKANDALAALPAGECWRRISQDVLSPAVPFAVHQLLYRRVFSDWDPAQGPPPAWSPSEESARASNIGRVMADLGLDDYAAFHRWSVREREAFWDHMIERLGIVFRRPYERVVDLSAGVGAPSWLPGALLNIVESCFRTDPAAPAILHQGAGGPIETVTYGEIDRLSARVANGLCAAGFSPGDALAVDMPMTMESVAIYLGVIRAGCVVVSISDSFAPDEIATRLRITESKGIFTQDVILRAGKSLPLYDRVVRAGAPKAIVLAAEGERPAADLREGDVAWADFLSDEYSFDAVACEPEAATNVLFSSGTTGEPKAIPWSCTTPIKSAMDGFLHHDIRPGDVVAWPTNLGWMMGPWLVYAALVNHATVALYTDAPTGRDFGKFVADAGVTMLGLVPSLVKAWRASGCMEGLDWRRIKVFSSTGECSSPDDMLYLMMLAGYKPVIEYCGGTEIGGGYITGTVVQAASPATFSTPSLGLDFVILDEEGKPTDNGEVFLIPPSIGLSTRLLNHDHDQVYFEDVPAGPDGAVLRRHGDQIETLGAAYCRHHGRADDTMNLGGIKVSSAEIERTLNRTEGVHETAAVAVPPEGGGPDRLIICAVLAPEAGGAPEEWRARFQTAIRERLNPLFKIHDVKIVDSLPRTASNKVVRRLLRKEYEAG